MRFALFILFVACIHTCLGQDPKYCDPALCTKYGQPTKFHIACPNVAVNNCPSDAREIPMTEERKAYILDFHNKKRNEIASGLISGFQPATRMPVVTWDDELAYIAAVNAKQCKYGHDECRNTAIYLWSGQNIAWSAGYSEDQSILDTALNGWWDEYKDATQIDIDNYKSSTSVIGHFTAMAQDRMNKIGCAAMFYNTNERIMVCNYSFTNIINSYVYLSGTTAGSACKTCKDCKYKNLCGVNEVVDPNPTF